METSSTEVEKKGREYQRRMQPIFRHRDDKAMLTQNLFNAIANPGVSAPFVPLSQLVTQVAGDFSAQILQGNLSEDLANQLTPDLFASFFEGLTTDVVPLESPHGMLRFFRNLGNYGERYKHAFPHYPKDVMDIVCRELIKVVSKVSKEQCFVASQEVGAVAAGIQVFMVNGDDCKLPARDEDYNMRDVSGLHAGVRISVLRPYQFDYVAATLGVPEDGYIMSSIILHRSLFYDEGESLSGSVEFQGWLDHFEAPPDEGACYTSERAKFEMAFEGAETSSLGLPLAHRSMWRNLVYESNQWHEWEDEPFGLIVNGLQRIYGEVSPWIPFLFHP